MIWVIMTASDKDSYVTQRNQNFIKEALGTDNVTFVNVQQDEDSLNDLKISEKDIVIAQTRNGIVLDKIGELKAKNTSESSRTIVLTKNKEVLKEELYRYGISFPKSYSKNDLRDDYMYFVKPLMGEDSNMVDNLSVCKNAEEVRKKVEEIESMGDVAIIEDFIAGTECTAACIVNQKTGDVDVYPIFVELTTPYNILTHEAKMQEEEVCRVCNLEAVKETARKVCKVLGIQHYLRIDFRIYSTGVPFVIDCNLFPGLGPTDHFAKCLLLTENMSYIDALKAVIASAS